MHIGDVVLVREPTDLGYLEYAGLVIGFEGGSWVRVEVIRSSPNTCQAAYDGPSIRRVENTCIVQVKSVSIQEIPYVFFH